METSVSHMALGHLAVPVDALGDPRPNYWKQLSKLLEVKKILGK